MSGNGNEITIGTWKELFEITPYEVTKTILGSLDDNTFLACRLVCQGWRRAVNTFRPKWNEIKKLPFTETFEGAIRAGHSYLVQMLASNVANFQIREGFPHPVYPILLATVMGDASVVEILVNMGASVHTKGALGVSSLHYAASQGNAAVAEVLLSNGANTNSYDDNSLTPLNYAVLRGQVASVESLLANGADVNAERPEDKNTNLHIAVGSNHLPVVKLLVAHGAFLEAKNACGHSPLHTGAYYGHEDIVEFLLNHGADVDSLSPSTNDTPLLSAVFRDHLSVAKLLIAHGASLNAKDIDGDTALHLAVEGAVEMVELLCSHGADVYAKNDDNNTPVQRGIDILEDGKVQLDVLERLFHYMDLHDGIPCGCSICKPSSQC